MYINGNSVRDDLYVISPTRQHTRYARLARDGSLLRRLTYSNNPMSFDDVFDLAMIGIIVVMVFVIISLILGIFSVTAAIWALCMGVGIGVIISLVIPLLAGLRAIAGKLVQAAGRSQSD
mgnify:CR=1 FL=1